MPEPEDYVTARQAIAIAIVEVGHGLFIGIGLGAGLVLGITGALTLIALIV